MSNNREARKLRARMFKLHADGWSDKAIAQALKVSVEHVTETLRPAKRDCKATYAALTGQTLSDPNRADRVLRRFSFLDEPQEETNAR